MSLVFSSPFNFLKTSAISGVTIVIFSRINSGACADEASRVVSAPSAATSMSKSAASIVFSTLIFSGSASAINSNGFDCERY